MSDGLCECGCGGATRISPRTEGHMGWVKGKPRRYIQHHHLSKIPSENPAWRGGRKVARGYVYLHNPNHPNASAKGYVAEHVVVASRALGKPLPAGALVHHVNGNGLDNRPENLVVCQGVSYHNLLHYRIRALAASGHADWHYCQICKTWDALENMVLRPPSATAAYHNSCNTAKSRTRYHRLKAVA